MNITTEAHTHYTPLNDKESLIRYQAVFDHMDEGVAVYRPVDSGDDFIFTDFNAAAEKIENVSRDQLIGKSVLEVFPWFKRFGLINVFRRVYLTGLEEYFPISEYKEDKIESWRENFVFKLASGEIVTIYKDLTLQKQAEFALKRSERHLKKAYKIAHIGTWEYDITTRKIKLSKELYRIIGIDPEDITPKLLRERIHSLDRKSYDLMRKVLRENGVAELEYRYVQPDGNVHWVWEQAETIYDKARVPVKLFGTVQDITDRKQSEVERQRLEMQLRLSQKMEALGTLAGGIAHDFNNILSTIIGYSEIMEMYDIPPDSPLRADVAEIMIAAHRAKDLVKQILTFSRRAEQELAPVELVSIIKETVRFLRASLPSTIQIELFIKTSKSMVLADPTQVHQVLMNLCTNAWHAMENKGGVLEIKLSDRDFRKNETALEYGLKRGKYIRLSISDTGCGIDQKALERIFDPYFTTKKQGEGTGLGLAVVHGIVKSHGGVIRVNSTPGSGTNFEIYLPKYNKVYEIPKRIKNEKIPNGNERILFVDDETSIARFAKMSLENRGYTVTTSSGSEDALDVFKRNYKDFDLVITDQTMPHMTGLELARKCKAIRPDIPIILCTGYGKTLSSNTLKQIGIRRLLKKPVGSKDFAKIVRAVLDE